MRLKSILYVLFSLALACAGHTTLAQECIGLAHAIMDCSAYKCVADLTGERVRYEVLGSNEEGVCKYSESDETGFALCRVSQEDFSHISNYLVQLFTKSSNVRYHEIARMKARTCRFYRVRGNSFIKRDEALNESDVRAIERVVGMRIRKEEVEGVRSMFFDEEDLKKLD
ncbi:hypothetical protein APHNP_0627 [Anaplasma phagocytophilum str. ApNP]|uniref:Lipoprotein n=1 Tax=Anaplasma phagocytophilum str. ApNP TaxID=1359153 RepID=A0A0F3NGK9_ANAPH|nr:hypothetical protein [Anaplasma phagocytophilum]AGR79011.1 hypothetical protein YYU_04890 [Anaplasma phagocytophilum str. HZ2]AGR80258.1 hypothetical protein WSQ_04920 [Anaplasma phagocytophilum str. JM]AGR81512.1 hypothetical protein YYY_04920 [Anaplasma phagocytophilum str. Dog2]KDB56880.1 hypothetical protein P030_06140 [Anaplasma phagocytophilum str. CRT35]KJV66842.1 hypothetical protein APHNP_0627 [Anaplasma phagocytophilum str. ApNP]